jgi:hypothetical protein
MKSITPTLKQEFSNLDSIEERLKLLKDKYKDETAYIVTCGPSLSKHNINQLKLKLKDKLVISIKQAYNVLKEETDFHLLNTYNLSKYEWDPKTIAYWSLSKSFANEQLQRIVNINAPIDLYIPVINPPYIDRKQTTQATCNFDDFYMMETHTEVKFGIGMMYEMGVPLTLLLGCKKIVIIGWDLGDPNNNITPENWSHFYTEKRTKITGPVPGEIAEILKSTDKLYDWFISKNIDVKLISDQSFISPKFPRITLNDIK